MCVAVIVWTMAQTAPVALSQRRSTPPQHTSANGALLAVTASRQGSLRRVQPASADTVYLGRRGPVHGFGTRPRRGRAWWGGGPDGRRPEGVCPLQSRAHRPITTIRCSVRLEPSARSFHGAFVNPTQVKDKLRGLLGVRLTDEEVHMLLRDVVAGGGGVTIDVDDGRYRLVRRDGKFGLKKVDRRRTSTLPPFR